MRHYDNQRHHNNSEPKKELAPVERPVEITLQTLLETGSHFGTPTAAWNPKMTPYIYGIRNNVYIINLEKTLENWDRARSFVVDTVSNGGDVLFVGTKRQVKDVLRAEASACGAHFVSEKWLGGTLTNLAVIRKTIQRLSKLEDLLKKAEANSNYELTKKEKLDIQREIDDLNDRLGGLRNMKSVPKAIFITDPVKDHIAVEEAVRMQIPIIALTDTDCDPSFMSYPIPANDDGTSALALFVRGMADAVIEGKLLLEEKIKAGKVTLAAEVEMAAEVNLEQSQLEAKKAINPERTSNNLQVSKAKKRGKSNEAQQSTRN